MTGLKAPTPYLWTIGRTKTDGAADYEAVHKIQAGYKVTPLSQWGKAVTLPPVKINPTVDMKTPPKIQVDTMSAAKYFAYAAELMKVNPPHATDQPIIARMKDIGIEVGKSFEFEKLDPVVQKASRERACRSPGADEMEGGHSGPRRQSVVDEYRHDGRLWQLLP